jgi:hypothetical protein
MSDMTDAVGRMREMNAALSDWDGIRVEGERISREEAYKALTAEIATLHAEIERLRLTAAEQAAVGFCVTAALPETAKLGGVAGGLCRMHTATLRGLLERMPGTGDCPAQDNTATQDNSQFAKRESDSPQAIAKCDATPPADPTSDECSVPPQWTSRPYWVDPPSGWRYGFPRLYDPATDGDVTAWMIANGYPERLARQGLACTFTEWKEDGEK